MPGSRTSRTPTTSPAESKNGAARMAVGTYPVLSAMSRANRASVRTLRTATGWPDIAVQDVS
jgi:hypothetical protein